MLTKCEVEESFSKPFLSFEKWTPIYRLIVSGLPYFESPNLNHVDIFEAHT